MKGVNHDQIAYRIVPGAVCVRVHRNGKTADDRTLGGGGSLDYDAGLAPFDIPGAVSLTGSQPASETPLQQQQRGDTIVGRADSLRISAWYGGTTLPDFPAYRSQTSCTGTRCTIDTGFLPPIPVDVADISLEYGPHSRTVLEKYGITTNIAVLPGQDHNSYGIWMDHSGFTSHANRITTPTPSGEFTWTRYMAMAGGDLSQSRPSGAATWQGLMVGRVQTGPQGGELLQGDTMLTFDPGEFVLDAAFSEIKNLHRGSAHTTPSVRIARRTGLE